MNDKVQKDFEKLSKDNDALVKEYHLLTSTQAPVVLLENENTIISADKNKFLEYIQHITKKNETLIQTIQDLKEQLVEQGISSPVIQYILIKKNYS